MSSVEKIRRLFAKSTITVSSEVDERIIRASLTALDEPEKTKSIPADPDLRRITMKVRIMKFTTAAAIIAVALVGIYLLGGSPDGSNVAWAQVARNMDNIHSFTCRMTSWEKPAQASGGAEVPKVEETTMRFWYSDEFGFKMEQYSDGDPSLIVCMLRQSKEGLRIWPKDKRYVRQPLGGDGQNIMSPQDMDPREWVRRFMTADYKPLGESVIDGVKVEGVETNELGVIRTSSAESRISDYKARLWVDVESLLPVRIEEEYTLGSVRSGGGSDQFQWNAVLTLADMEPDIPSDYTLVQ
ncbi:MAG: hypothetical protein P8Z79_25175 [Sedimentisphaerales bacterium]